MSSRPLSEIADEGSVRRDEEPACDIRAMNRDDLDQVLAIENQAYGFPWARGIFEDCLRARYRCVVLERDGAVIGYGVMMTAVGESHVLNLCIADEWRCRGLGETLLRFLLDEARQTFSMRALLEVRPSNAAALALYRRLGFEKIGVRRRYYPSHDGREDGWMYALEFVD